MEQRPIAEVIEAVKQMQLPPELAARRDRLLADYRAAVDEIRERAARVYGELMLREIEIHFMDGFAREACLLPAMNNLAVRRSEIQDELVSGVGQLQAQLRRGIQRLMEDLEDYGSNQPF